MITEQKNRLTPLFLLCENDLGPIIDFDLAQLLTLKMAKLGPIIDFTAKKIDIYIYIYMCCEVIIWAKFGHFRCYDLGQVGVIIWAKLFLAYKNRGFKRFFAHTVII